MVTDPVCYKELDPTRAQERARFRGQTYYFHSRRCRVIFESDPSQYAAHIPEKVYGDHTKARRP